MNFLSLEYFVVIAQEQSIKNAAERLYISQQSLSEHVKKLEQELGVELIKRTRPHTLTKAGEILLEAAKEILETKARVFRDIAGISGSPRAGSITVGIHPAGVPPFLPELIMRFTQAFPDYSVNVVSRDEAIHPSAHDDIGLFFLRPSLDDSMEHILLREDHLAVLVSRTLLEKEYGARSDVICEELSRTGDLSLIRKLPFINIKREYHRELLDLRQYHIVPELETDSHSLAMSMCLKGMGALISIEDATARTLGDYNPQTISGLLTFRLNHKPERYSLAISHKKGKKLSEVEQAFIAQAQRMFQSG